MTTQSCTFATRIFSSFGFLESDVFRPGFSTEFLLNISTYRFYVKHVEKHVTENEKCAIRLARACFTLLFSFYRLLLYWNSNRFNDIKVVGSHFFHVVAISAENTFFVSPKMREIAIQFPFTFVLKILLKKNAKNTRKKLFSPTYAPTKCEGR